MSDTKTATTPADAPCITIRECTEEMPYTKNRDNPGDKWKHLGAKKIGSRIDGYPGRDIQRYRCSFCGTIWQEELQQ